MNLVYEIIQENLLFEINELEYLEAWCLPQVYCKAIPSGHTVGASVTWDSENMGLQPHECHSGCSNAHDIRV